MKKVFSSLSHSTLFPNFNSNEVRCLLLFIIMSAVVFVIIGLKIK